MFNQKLKNTSITSVKGITPKLIRDMHRLGLYSVYDVMTFFPQHRHFREMNECFTKNWKVKYRNGHFITVDVVRTSSVKSRRCKNGATYVHFTVRPVGINPENDPDNKHLGGGFWLNTFSIPNFEQIAINHRYFRITGKWGAKYRNVLISQTKGMETGKLEVHKPLIIKCIGKYTAKHGVPQREIRWAVLHTFLQFGHDVEESIPYAYRKRAILYPRPRAMWSCHFPNNDRDYYEAVKSEKFDELYAYAYQLQELNRKRKRKVGFQIKAPQAELDKFTQSLPYRLTHDQHEAVLDILHDMQAPFQMARLLQGDVGSGKTVVAAYAILAAIKAGYQAALMVPTSPLAAQHYVTFTKMFKGLGVNIVLLTGKTSYHDKRVASEKLQAGKIQLAIGTEALYQKQIKYQKLGLTVIDEQHRFGVRQRRTLERKTKGCNVLSMTATPIPRTLATALYNAMDVSQIREMPKGRKPVITKWLRPTPSLYADTAALIKRQAQKGGQTFVIAKLVKPSKQFKNQLDSTTVYQKLLPYMKADGIKMRLLHGRMKTAEKDKLLNEFTLHKFDALVATSVVEVGVDVPNATQIIIMNAEAYGLAQLHQLRGRVGRNSIQSYCYLISKPRSKQALARLKIMESTSNGFKVAEADLKLRGGGNLFGRAQSGLPDFPMANLKDDKDKQILQMTSQFAQRHFRDLDNNR